jgi:hypothetical protein
VNFTDPTPAELSALRADPLLFEQELDVRPGVAESVEAALATRAGRRYWRAAASGQLYAIELGDFGRGRPSMALVYGFWPRFEPRPLTDEEIDTDLAELCRWLARVCPELDESEMGEAIALAEAIRTIGDGFRLPAGA